MGRENLKVVDAALKIKDDAGVTLAGSEAPDTYHQECACEVGW